MHVFVVGSFVVACSVKVARLPRAGESLKASAFVAEPGGKGFNLALALHRLGAEVDGAFAIGSDPFAAVARDAFGASGLSADMLVAHEGSTGAGIGFIDEAGENCLAVSLGANGRLAAEDVAGAARLGPGDLCLATFESPDGAIREAFQRARRGGAATLLNPSPTRPIAPDLLGLCDILVVNEVEARDLGTVRPDGTLAGHPPDGPSTIVVTLGPQGSIAYRRGEPCWRQPAFRVAVVDTIGAGDGFTAGLAAGLMQGRTLPDAMRMASACGALTSARLGTSESFPTAPELDGFLALRPMPAGDARTEPDPVPA